MKNLLKALVAVCAMSMASGVSATLIDRGSGLIYDDVLNITWLQDASVAGPTQIEPDGWMNWFNANEFASTFAFGGYEDWRLPTMDVDGDGVVHGGLIQATSGIPVCSSELECRDNELAYMYYWNLSPVAGTQTPDFTNLLGDTFPFTGVQRAYWSGTSNQFNDALAYQISFDSGFVDGDDSDENKNNLRAVWLVRDGDVQSASVPEPATTALLALGLFGVGAAARRRKVS